MQLSHILFYLFLFSCLGVLLSGYKDTRRFYQYPAISALACLVFYVPTLFFLLNEPGIFPIGPYNLFVFNSLLCFWLGILGYSIGVKAPIKSKVKYEYNYDSIVRILVIYVIIGAISSVLVPADEFGNSTTSGMVVIYIYFSRLLRPAAIILFCLYLSKKNKFVLFLFLVWLFFSLKFLIISGRRSEFFTIVTIFGLPLYYIKNAKINRNLVIPGIIVSFAVIMLFPVLRPYTKAGKYDEILDISFDKVVKEYASGENANEIVDASLNMASVTVAGEYNLFYKSVYNKIINQYASRTLFGPELKESLKVDEVNMDEVRSNYGVYGTHGFLFYLTPTGFANAYTELYFFGGFLYFFFAYFYGFVYKYAISGNSLKFKILAIYLGVMTLFAIYDSLPNVISVYFPPYLFVFFHVFIFAKKRIIIYDE